MAKKQVKSMGEASKEVAKFKPTPLELGDGSVVTIGKLGWLDFTDMLLRCSAPIKAYLSMQRADRLAETEALSYMQIAAGIQNGDLEKGSLKEARAAWEKAEHSFDELSEALQHSPELLIELLCKCSDQKDEEFWTGTPEKQRDYDEVLLAGVTAVQVNFGGQKMFAPFLKSLIGGLTTPVEDESESDETTD